MSLRRVHDESAQGVIEFALIGMILVLMFLGTVDFSRFMYFDTAIRNAARIGSEVAGNHCTPACGALTMTTDDFVVQATVCEANIGLQPQPASSVGCVACKTLSSAPGGCNDPYNVSSTTYNATDPCSGGCTKDVYVSPIVAPNTSGNPTGQAITVTVGYDFKPISFLMSPFFHEMSCYSGDSTSTNHHTLCATASGRASY